MGARPYTPKERKLTQIKRRENTTLYVSGAALVIDRDDGVFVVDMADRPGSPPVGRGRTLKEALGDWLLNNQRELGMVVDITEAVVPYENRRQARELASR